MRPLFFLILMLSSLRLMAAENLLTPESKTRLNAALGDLYNMDFNKADGDFSHIIRGEPENPFAYLSDAGALWWETSVHNGIVPDSARVRSRFEKDIARSIQGAETLLKSPFPRDQAKGHFIMGLSLGELGEWDFINHHWFKAFFTGKKAIKHLKSCLKIDSTYYDAYLGLGSYDYQVSHFRFLLKAGAFLGGLHANEQRGIEHLIMAEDRGPYSSDQAAIFLVTLYALDKKDYATALSIIHKLRAKYPESMYFELIEVALSAKLRNWDRSLSLGHEIFEKIKADPDAYRRRLLYLACGFSPPNCLNLVESAELVDWTTHAIDAAPSLGNETVDPEMLPLLHLYRGYGEDITGSRDKAVSDYQWVIAHPDFLGGHAQAAQCVSAPCSRDTILDFLRLTRDQSKTTIAPIQAP
jgi:tetratricopeptide (TPR) repeat protein